MVKREESLENEADLESEALDEFMPEMSTRQYQIICKFIKCQIGDRKKKTLKIKELDKDGKFKSVKTNVTLV